MPFNQEYGKLNAEQKQAVNELSRNILLLASAGTGKTNSVALRIANIIKQNKASADEILCLTFTNRACKEMGARIKEAVGAGANRLTIKTFHSFCYQIIQAESKKHTDLPYDSIIFDEDDCKEVIKDLITAAGNVPSLQKFIDFIKEQKIPAGNKTYAEIIEYAFHNHRGKIEEICTKDRRFDVSVFNNLRQSGSRLIESYNACLAERHALDFNDLLIQVHELFKSESILQPWRSKFKYLHIDEAQDTNESEYIIISKLFPGNNIMLCADYFQTIYEWRGSAPRKTLELFKASCSPAVIYFRRNYRATRKLLQASTEYLTNAFGESASTAYNAGLIPESPTEGADVKLYEASSPSAEAAWIYGAIKRLSKQDRLKTAILSRGNKTNSELSHAFDMLNSHTKEPDRIRFMQIEEYRYFRRREIKDILAYLKLSANKHDETSFKRILQAYAAGIGERTIGHITNKDNRRLGIRLTDFLTTSAETFHDPYELLINELSNGNVVIFDVESTGVNTAYDEIVQIAAVKINIQGTVISSFERYLTPSRPVGGSEHIHGFSDEFLSTHGEDPKLVLSAFAKYIEGALAVGHNVTFDIAILNSQLRRTGLNDIGIIDYYDTLDMARRFHPKLENHKLETLCGLFQTKTVSDHNAFNDVLATGEILIKILNEKVIPTTLPRTQVFLEFMPRFETISRELSELKKKSIHMRPSEFIIEIIKQSKIKDLYNW